VLLTGHLHDPVPGPLVQCDVTENLAVHLGNPSSDRIWADKELPDGSREVRGIPVLGATSAAIASSPVRSSPGRGRTSTPPSVTSDWLTDEVTGRWRPHRPW
jgi:hypothetical protein